MTDKQKTRLKELEEKMAKSWYFCDEFTEDDYEEYLVLDGIRHKEYREKNEPEITEYFEKHIKGKSWNEIDQDRWDFYSDWHKDVYGYRPRTTEYCG